MDSDFFVQLISSITTAGALTTFLIWISRSWISERLKGSIANEYSQKLETHKAELLAQNSVEIEKLKATLSITAAERNIKFSKLHEQRALVIAETYSLLRDVFISMGDYVKFFVPSGDKSIKERELRAIETHQALRDYYVHKVIYLPKSTANKIEKIHTDLLKIYHEFTYEVASEPPGSKTKDWNDISKKMSGEMQEALSELETEFRNLLGDES